MPRSNDDESHISKRPAGTPESREAQLVALAVDLAEKQLREGTASAQVISHYLKLGSSREKIEQENLKLQGALYGAKAKAIEETASNEAMFKEAIEAMRVYSGASDE